MEPADEAASDEVEGVLLYCDEDVEAVLLYRVSKSGGLIERVTRREWVEHGRGRRTSSVSTATKARRRCLQLTHARVCDMRRGL